MGLNIKKIKIDDIKPASYNPRKIEEKDFKKLSKSIEQFGLVDPIIINLKNHNIIGGHQRFDYLYYEKKDTELHLIELGDIGWVFSDTDLKVEDDKHEKALNLALNRISGEWNYDELNNLLDELAEFNLDSLTGFDYNLDEIDYEFVPLDEEYFDDDDTLVEELDTIIEDEDEFEDIVPEKQTKKETKEKNKGTIIIITEIDKDSVKKNETYITSSHKLINLIKNNTKKIR